MSVDAFIYIVKKNLTTLNESQKMVSKSSKELINDPKWTQRMENYFEFVDKRNRGIITIVEIQNLATQLEIFCKPTPSKMVKLRAQLYTFWGKVGLKANVLMTKKEFLENINKLGMEEVERRSCGLETVLEKCNKAWFDVVDTNGDGRLDFRELEGVMRASGMNPEAASAWLRYVSKEEEGAIMRHEFVESEHKFWYKAKGVKWRGENERISRPSR